MGEIVIRIDLNVGKRGIGRLMALACLVAAAPELASESITLTTYYPAPSGVYSQMITTGNAYLARDGGYVDVNTLGVPGAGVVLSVSGSAAVSTSLGIGNAANTPTQTLDVTGRTYLHGGTTGINATPSASWALQVAQNSPADGGNLGVTGNVGVAGHLEIGSGALAVPTPGAPTLDVRSGSIRMLNATCTPTGYGTGYTSCPPGQYATLTAGIWSAQTIINDTVEGTGTMLCCL